MSKSYRNKLASLKTSEHPFAKYVRILGKGKSGSRSLDQNEAYSAMQMIIRGEVEDVQLGAFLMLLRVKEESHQELAGFVLAIRDHIKAPADDINVDLDWSSYAGKTRQLPWYILSALLIAQNGYRVFMHGGSGHTIGRLYSEDVLKDLNIPVAQNWQQVKQQLNDTNFSFMPLSAMASPVQDIMELRNYLGLRSPVHTLSRLLNPLAANYSIQSIFHPAYGESHQLAAHQLKQQNAAVFKGEGGEVERKPEATCLVKQVIAGEMTETVWPKMLEGRQPQHEQLNIMDMVSVWQGNCDDDYGVNAVIGTTAIAIQLLKPEYDQQQALALATQWWQSRDFNKL
jgi:anthranilate phosphoribosyltransferase